MNDNRAQYTEQGRERDSERRRVQGTQYPQGRRPQNRGKSYTQNRVMSEREQFMRQQQMQLQRQQKILQKKVGILSFFLCVVLILNVSGAAFMYSRMRHMENTLKVVESQLSLGRLESETDVRSTFSGGETGSGAISTAAEGQNAPDLGDRVMGQAYIDLCGLEYVDSPRERTMEQVLDRLEQLAKEDERIEEILEAPYQYPDKLLEALANNPEMADFVTGYVENAGKVSGVLTEDESKADFPLFLQWDPRWGYGEYGDNSCIALAGCGPTCLSMALFYLTGDESLTPDRMAEYSMKNGYYISGTGTAWALLQDVPEKYGVSVSQPEAEENTMRAALDGGSVIICSMGPGDFTAAGHFIVIYGYDRTGFLVNDPNCVARSRRTWSFSELKGQIKNMWVLGGNVKYDGVTFNQF